MSFNAICRNKILAKIFEFTVVKLGCTLCASQKVQLILYLILPTISYKMQDHSQGGQKLIDYRHTRYGNEVYRGCFLEKDTIKRKLGITIPLTVHVRRLMTQEYCIYRCR